MIQTVLINFHKCTHVWQLISKRPQNTAEYDLDSTVHWQNKPSTMLGAFNTLYVRKATHSIKDTNQPAHTVQPSSIWQKVQSYQCLDFQFQRQFLPAGHQTAQYAVYTYMWVHFSAAAYGVPNSDPNILEAGLYEAKDFAVL